MPVAPNRSGTGPDFTGSSGSGKSAPSGGPAGSSTGPVNIPAPGAGPAAILASLMFEILRDVPDRTVYGPSQYLNPGDQVQVMPRGANTSDNCFVSTSGNSDAKFPPRLQLKRGANPVPVTVRSLHEIGAYSDTVGEGILVVVQRRPS